MTPPTSSDRRIDRWDSVDDARWTVWALPAALLLLTLAGSTDTGFPLLRLAALVLAATGSLAARGAFARMALLVGVNPMAAALFAAAGPWPAADNALVIILPVAVAAGELNWPATAWTGAASLALAAALGPFLGQPWSPPQFVVLLAMASAAALCVRAAATATGARRRCGREVDALGRRIVEQSILLEINRSVHDLQTADTLLTLVQVISKVMGAPRAALLVADGDGALDLQESVFHADPSAQGVDLLLQPETFRQALVSDRPLLVTAVGEPPRPDLRVLAIPLHGQGGPIGLLVLEHDGQAAVGAEDEHMLRDLANTAVLAIENGRLHARIRRMADQDGLTGIFNHRYFQEWMRRELADEAAAGRVMSLIMLEVDRFKAYNDRYGHQMGDRILCTIARRLEHQARAWGGLCARYGGDEFVLALPGKDRGAAAAIAQELQDGIRATALEGAAHDSLPAVTVSLGVAASPANGQVAAALIASADQAMYAAKSQGGDRVSVARV